MMMMMMCSGRDVDDIISWSECGSGLEVEGDYGGDYYDADCGSVH